MEGKIITANSGERLDSVLRSMGHDLKTIFFKRDLKIAFNNGGEAHEVITQYHPGTDGSIVEECKHLCRMYDADYRHVVRPIALAMGEESNAKVLGYVMERARGQSLGSLLQYYAHSARTEVEKIESKEMILLGLESLDIVVTRLNAKGVGHGDLLVYNNIFVGAAAAVQLIDPAYDVEDAIKMDRMTIEEYRKFYDTLKGNVSYGADRACLEPLFGQFT